MITYEVNFDGLIGPTHNYAGLSLGNVASAKNKDQVSNPREAALQGLAKMRFLMKLGVKQAVLPPHMRPFLPVLRDLGFQGGDKQIIEDVATKAPALLRNCYAASAMWTANAATVSPSADTKDGKVHFTPANLTAMFHRHIEAGQTAEILRTVFADPDYFVHHPPLPGGQHMGDEGAANHNRFCTDYGESGVEVFVYGRKAFGGEVFPKKFPARQTKEASETIARLHGLGPQKTFFVQQNPEAIDAGAFHNDVVAVANRQTFLYHEKAFLNFLDYKADIQEALDAEIQFIEVPEKAVPLSEAVQSYLFNSQLISLDGTRQALILPVEAKENKATHDFLESMKGRGGIDALHFLDVRQSMRNGGGPACLRLRVALNEEELAAMSAAVLLDEERVSLLEDWVRKHYRDRLTSDDLADPALMVESFEALDALTHILQLGPIYPFQK